MQMSLLPIQACKLLVFQEAPAIPKRGLFRHLMCLASQVLSSSCGAKQRAPMAPLRL